MNLVGLSVCVSMFFSATKSFMEFWLKASFGSGWNMTKPDFLIFNFLRILGAFVVFFKMFFSCVFFFKISAISTPRTMTFRHKDYINTNKIAHKKSETFNFLQHFSGVFFFIHKFKNDVFVHDFLNH